MSGERYYAEHMGPGVALFDYDNDDDLDVSFHKGRCSGPGESSVTPSSRPRVRCHRRVGYFGMIWSFMLTGRASFGSRT